MAVVTRNVQGGKEKEEDGGNEIRGKLVNKNKEQEIIYIREMDCITKDAELKMMDNKMTRKWCK